MKLSIAAKTVAMLASIGLTVTAGQAQVLYSTDFSSPLYSDGNLVGQDGWVAHSGAGSVPVQVSNAATNGVITLSQGAGSREDVSRNVGFTIGSSEIWLATFDVTVSGGSTSVYFANFLSTSTNFTGRVFVAPLLDNDFTFGISSTQGSADALFSTGFSFNTPYTLTLGYNRATGLSTLAYGETTITSTTSSLLDINSIAFRQAGGNSVQVIDNLTVSAIPEPGTVAMLTIGLGLMLWRLRARRTA